MNKFELINALEIEKGENCYGNEYEKRTAIRKKES